MLGMCGLRRNLPQSHTRSQTQLAWAVILIRRSFSSKVSTLDCWAVLLLTWSTLKARPWLRALTLQMKVLRKTLINEKEHMFSSEKSTMLQNLGTGFCQQFFKHGYRFQWYSLQVMCPETWRLTFYSFLCKTGIIP